MTSEARRYTEDGRWAEERLFLGPQKKNTVLSTLDLNLVRLV